MARKKTGGGGWIVAAKWAGVLIAGVAGGYVWRSYAPLPLPEPSPLTSDRTAAHERADRLAQELADERRRADDAEAEAIRLRSEAALHGEDSETQQVLAADEQIKAMLKAN